MKDHRKSQRRLFLASCLIVILLGVVFINGFGTPGPQYPRNLLEIAIKQGVRTLGAIQTKIFLYAFTRNRVFRNALVLTPGTVFDMGPLKRDGKTCISLSLAMPFNLGDGAGLRVTYIDNSNQSELYYGFLDPAHLREHRKWVVAMFQIPVGAEEFRLRFEVDSGNNGNMTGDWFGLTSGLDDRCLFSLPAVSKSDTLQSIPF